MGSQHQIFDLDALKRAEQAYRKHLNTKPDDTTTRVNLAWCLFMMALHQAGQEMMLDTLTGPRNPGEPISEGRTGVRFDKDAQELMRDCLKQTYTVKQLSMQAKECTAVEQLQSLVKLSGGETAVKNAADDAVRILAEITWEIIHSAGNINQEG